MAEDQIKTPTTETAPQFEDEELSLKETILPIRDKDLPPIIREIVSNAPQNRKLPSFIACLSPLCALATRIRLNYYYDGARQSALLLQVIIEAPQSSGKQFAADIEKLLMENTLQAHDKEQRRLEQKYRERKRSRGANEKMETAISTLQSAGRSATSGHRRDTAASGPLRSPCRRSSTGSQSCSRSSLWTALWAF